MLLAVDTSTRTIGVAIYDGIRVLSEMTWISKNHHTIELAPSVIQALSLVGVETNELKSIGVAIGPGGFTGLRIGLALAKGLALSHRIPIIGIPTLDIVASALPVSHGLRLAALLEAGRRRLAVGWYLEQDGKWQPDGEPLNLSIEEFVEQVNEPIIVCGEINREVYERLRKTESIIPSPVHCLRRPAVLAELAWKRMQTADFDDPAILKPIYLHHGKPIPE
jgi:tRNA threonylcarbamoyladenosine biosynthesis protein TsaB